jgi:mannose-6-phosphate isomerase-like protein (cupin superfamily)
MDKFSWNILIVAAAVAPAFAMAPMADTSSKPATYITKEEVDTVNKTPGVDRTIRVVDIGYENYAVGIIHRGATRAAAGPGAARGAGGGAGGAAATQAAAPCGASGAAVPAGTPSGITHDSQTEGYYIVSGAGEMVTGGHIMNGRKSAPDSEVTTTLNGPSCNGAIVGSDVVKRQVKPGDVIIIPAGTPHGWSDIPDHVDYLSFRPSQKLLTAGYVNPAIK